MLWLQFLNQNTKNGMSLFSSTCLILLITKQSVYWLVKKREKKLNTIDRFTNEVNGNFWYNLYRLWEPEHNNEYIGTSSIIIGSLV